MMHNRGSRSCVWALRGVTAVMVCLIPACGSVDGVHRANAKPTGGRTANVPYWGSQPPSAQEGERLALRTMAELIAQYPTAPRYTVNWTAPGTKFGGVKPKVTAFNPTTGIFWDAFELTGQTSIRLQGVEAADITAVAQAAGDFAQLKARLKPQ